MTDYVRGQDFALKAGKDSIPTVFNTEFNAVAAASATKADKTNPVFSGVMTVPALAATTSDAGNPLKVSPTQSSEVYMHAFPTGTKMAFYQAAAPLGWTQDITASLHDALLRTVTTGGGVTGGTSGFVTAPLSITDAHALTVAEMPAHTHTKGMSIGAVGGGGTSNPSNSFAANTGSTGGNAGHTHPITWTPKYVDLIMCVKS